MKIHQKHPSVVQVCIARMFFSSRVFSSLFYFIFLYCSASVHETSHNNISFMLPMLYSDLPAQKLFFFDGKSLNFIFLCKSWRIWSWDVGAFGCDWLEFSSEFYVLCIFRVNSKLSFRFRKSEHKTALIGKQLRQFRECQEKLSGEKNIAKSFRSFYFPSSNSLLLIDFITPKKKIVGELRPCWSEMINGI